MGGFGWGTANPELTEAEEAGVEPIKSIRFGFLACAARIEG
jgi:hypothetical protein